MRITVLGTGTVGQTLADGFARLDHDVTVGTRDVAAALARTDPDAMGNPGFGAWSGQHPDVGLAEFGSAAADVVVNAVRGSGTLAALDAVGEQALAGAVLLDVANPLDFSSGVPSSLAVVNTDSLGEQVQREVVRDRA